MNHSKTRLKKRLIIAFSLCFLLTGCQSTVPSSPSYPKTNETFDQFLTDSFQELVTSDTLTLHYTIKDRSNYPIDEIDQIKQPTFGTVQPSSLNDLITKQKEKQQQLLSFSKEELSLKQQQDYDIFAYYLEEELNGMPYFYYQTIFSPVTGIQAQLPVLLSEYRLENRTDIEEYLALLLDLNRYFTDLFAIEQQKAAMGLGMQDFALDDVIEQCLSYLLSNETNCLLTSFEYRLNALVSKQIITKREQQLYELENKQIVSSHIIPAYKQLIEHLTSLKGTATITGGICNLKNGNDYYEYLVSTSTSSTLQPQEMKKQIIKRLNDNQNRLIQLLQQQPNILQEYETASIPITDPNDILSTLQANIQKDFPKSTHTSYELKTVDPSLSEYLSPAFYLTPPIDDSFSNIIYLNTLSSSYEQHTLYPTLAHEGYPGHLYQNTYFYATNPNPIRSLLNFNGYSEGWATYVEYHCYENIDYGMHSSAIATLEQYQMDLSLGISSLVDIGVNYDGWTLLDCATFLKEYGISDEETIYSLYVSVIEEPANYLKYYIGFLQFESLREQQEQKKTFRTIDFHKTILDLGPAPFSIVQFALNNN